MRSGPEFETIHHDPILGRWERREIWWDRLRSYVLPLVLAGTVVATVVAAPPILIRLLSEDYITKDMMAKLDDEKPLLANEKRYGVTEVVEDWVNVQNYPDSSQVLGSIQIGTKIASSIHQGLKVVTFCGNIPGLDPAHVKALCAIDYGAVALTKAPDKNETFSPDSIAALEAVAFYNGTVLITKEVKGQFVNIRTAPVTSDNNTVAWDKIISLADFGVKNSNVFKVENPLLVEGDNPTYDPSRFPSKWLTFWAKVLVNDQPRTVERMKLYLNISQQTILSGHVQPDTTPWDENIVPVKVSGDVIVPQDPSMELPAVKDLNIVRTSPD